MINLTILSLIYLIGIGLLLIFNELNYRRLGVNGEITRKFAHFTATLATVPFPYIFSSHWYVLVLSSVFFAVLFITQYGNQLKSIHDIERKSIGSYLLPLSIYVTFLVSYMLHNKFLYILPILILAVCDPMAAILGINIKNFNGRIKLFGNKFKKTWLGSGTFLVTSFIISLIALYFHHSEFNLKTFWLALLIAATSTLSEFFSWRGSDNLTIPLSVVLILVLFL
jgi:dolichol kinase